MAGSLDPDQALTSSLFDSNNLNQINGEFMKFNKSVLLTILAVGVGASLIDARPEAKTPQIVKPFAKLAKAPINGGIYLVKEVVLPIAQFPVDLVKHVFKA
jgi:hypothetical protein